MSSPVASCSFVPSSATGQLNSGLRAKNPGLSLNLNLATGSNSRRCTVIRKRSLSVFDSCSNTPALDPSTDSDSESDSDCEDGGDVVQYVYIPADGPFHRDVSTPRKSAYTSFNGFPFACDALAEEDPLFARTPDAWFDEELQRIVSASDNDVDSGIFVWANDSVESPLHQRNWPSSKQADATLFSEHPRRSPMIFDDDELRQYL